ncbi:hypothetical protein FRC02_006129 [Tulasnella sp. 418]|nr:hypothetical protein FRC02_006129 [Tulasnella sp. 418]
MAATNEPVTVTSETPLSGDPKSAVDETIPDTPRNVLDFIKETPRRQDSTWSSIGQGFEDPTAGPPTFFSIFQDAAKYGDALMDEFDEEAAEYDDSPELTSDESSIQESPFIDPLHLRTPRPTTKDEIAEAIARDLIETNEETNNVNATTRLVQLSVSGNAAGLDGSSASETGSIADSDSGSTSSEKSELNDIVIPLLVKEFGALAEEGEEERLVAEADSAYFKEVAILGIVHLTTHRLAFHASLLSTRPDLLPGSQLIKAGPVIIHREGLHRKKRLWLELSHDMVSTFPDATDEGRVRPLKTVLLSTIKQILPVDPNDNKSIKFIFQSSEGKRITAHVEFDTTESSMSWRRELTGALYMYRRNRRSVLDSSATGGHQGVRFAIPLHRINSFDTRSWASFATVINFQLISDRAPESMTPGATWRSNDDTPNAEVMYDLPAVLAGYQPTAEDDADSLTLAVIQGFKPEELVTHIDEAKVRRFTTPSTNENGDKIFIDFGELAFAETVEELKKEGEDSETILKGSKDTVSEVRKKFAFEEDESVWCTRAIMGRAKCSSGYIVISPRFICFWSKSLVSDTKLRFAAHDVTSVFVPQSRPFASVLGYHCMVLQIRGHKDIDFEFRSHKLRDEAIERINATAAAAKQAREAAEAQQAHAKKYASECTSRQGTLSPKRSVSSSQDTSATTLSDFEDVTLTPAEQLACTSMTTPTHKLASVNEILERIKTRVVPSELIQHFPKTINLPIKALHHIARQHFVCLTIGSRGDVQPYIALCLGLKEQGHDVTIVTHEEYKKWVEGFGITHSTAGGDPGALMKLSVEHKMFSPQFFKESLGHFRKWLDDLLEDSFHAVRDAKATVLIESPSAMAGVHIAEALHIPYFRAFTMPWTRTVEYPHAFISPPEFVAGSFNHSTYVLFDNVFWKATAPQINRWRKRTLGLKSTNLEQLQQGKIPFLYNFSPVSRTRLLNLIKCRWLTLTWDFRASFQNLWIIPTPLLSLASTFYGTDRYTITF